MAGAAQPSGPTVLGRMEEILAAFLKAIAHNISRRDGAVLAHLFQIPADFSEEQYRQLLPVLDLVKDPLSEPAWRDAISGLYFAPSEYGDCDMTELIHELWPQVIRQFLLCLKLYRKVRLNIGHTSPKALFAAWLSMCQSFLRILQTGERWHLPTLYSFCDELWRISKTVEDADKNASMEEAARLVNKAFTICITDRNPSWDACRKWGTLRIVGLLFRIYFSLGQLNLCNNALRAIGASQLPEINDFPASERVTYRYYLGRYHFVSERYQQSCQELETALAECHQHAYTAKRQILHLLIPTKLLIHGLMPSVDLLARYNMNRGFYFKALTCIRTGNIALYKDLLDQAEHDLLKTGTFQIWESLSLIAYRTLVRRIWKLTESTRISLDTVRKVLARDLDIEEVGCIVAGLIDAGLVRGYISQTHATLVLSQKEPFPAISTCTLIKQ